MKSAEARICCRTLRLLPRPSDAFSGRDHPALTRFAAKSNHFRAGQPLDANQTGVASAQKKTPTLGPCLFAYPDPPDQRRVTGQEALEQCRRNRLQDISRSAWRGLKQQAVSTSPVTSPPVSMSNK
jgi:hypothetical protein